MTTKGKLIVIKGDICPLCGLRRGTEQEILDHIFAKHRDEKYRCPFCTRCDFTDTKLIRHIGSKHPSRFMEFFFDIPYYTLREEKTES